MEIGIFCPNGLALERNKALALDASVVTLELCGILVLGMEGQGKVSGSLWINAPLKRTSFSVSSSSLPFYGACQAGLTQIVQAAK